MKIAIAHAAWDAKRGPALERLARQVPDATIFASERREHASVWARRLWEWAGDDAVCCLNDDVTVCPDFPDVIDALPHHDIIALHTTAPAAPSLAMSGVRWLRSYWLTGPGYILGRGVARRLLAWADQVPRQLVASVNEDNLVMHFAWHEQKPIWHTIPALVDHDVSVPSTLGYDNHPMRRTNVPWHALPSLDLTTWPVLDAYAPLVECPWMPTVRLAATERALVTEPALCAFCWGRVGEMQSPATGATICTACLLECMKARLTR